MTRKVAAAGTAVAGALAAVAAYLAVGGLPGLLYAAGIALTLFGAVAIYAGRDKQDPTLAAVHDPASAAERPKRWKRKSHIIAELEVELAATIAELEEHRHACANLGAQLSRESELARRNEARLEQQIHELGSERDGLWELVAQERKWFERTLDELGGGIGRHESEIADLERQVDTLITK